MPRIQTRYSRPPPGDSLARVRVAEFRRAQLIVWCSRWALGVVLAACAGTVCAVDKSVRTAPTAATLALGAKPAPTAGTAFQANPQNRVATPPPARTTSPLRSVGQSPASSAGASGDETPAFSIRAGEVRFIGAGGPAVVTAIKTPPLVFLGDTLAAAVTIQTGKLKFIGGNP